MLLQEQEVIGAEPQAALPSQIRKLDLRIRLSQPARERLAARICDELDRYDAAVQPRKDNLSQWRHAWEVIPRGRNSRSQGSADTPSSLTRIYCDSHRTRLNIQIAGAKPPFAAVARSEEALIHTHAVQDAMEALLEEAKFASVADEVHGELAIGGNCFLRVTFEEETIRAPKREIDQDEDSRLALIAAGMPPADALWESVKSLKFVHEERLIFRGVRLTAIPFEDGVILPVTARDPEKAYGIGERMRITGADLMAGAKRGKYIQAEVNELLDRQGDPLPDYREEQLEDAGVYVDGSGQPSYGTGDEDDFGFDDGSYNEYEVVELCWKGDFNRDGHQEWAVLTVHPDTRRLLGIHWMEYEHGRPYYHLMRYIIRPGQLWGMGIGELITPFHNADEAVQCQLINHGDLVIALGFWMCDDRSGIRADSFRPDIGKMMRVQDVDGIKNMPPIPMPQEHYQLRSMFKDIADMLTASSNPSLGKVTDTSKTLGEVQIVQSVANQIFEDKAARVAWQWAEIADQVRWLAAQYMMQGEQAQVKYRRAAAPDQAEFASIDPLVLTSQIDLVPTGLTQLSDLQQRLQTAVLVNSTLTPHPLVMGNTEAMMELIKEFLDATRFSRKHHFLAALERGIQAEQQAQLRELQAATGALMGAEQGAPPAGAPPEEMPAEDQHPELAGSRVGSATGPALAPPPPGLSSPPIQ